MKAKVKGSKSKMNTRKTFIGNSQNWICIGYIVLAAFFLLLFATRSSFLYPCNDWNDANSYFSVGKAIFKGKIPYRDVFDQKGMYLYFFYGLAYLVSNTTFLGVFILEIILAVFDLFGILKILMLYVKRSTGFVLAPLVLAVTFSSESFYWGGSAEEVCLPFLIWGLYLSLNYFKNEYPQKVMSAKTLFIGGLLAGMVANIKFTVLGFFFAWMMCMAFSFLAEKDFLGAVKACLIFLGGMLLPFLPWVIYFALNQALYWWYWGYVHINVFVYSNLDGEGPGLMERIYTLAKLLYWVARKNLGYFIFVVSGVLFLLFGKNRKRLERLNILALSFFLFLGIYVGGSELPYYALPLSVFAVLGFAGIGRLWDRLYQKISKHTHHRSGKNEHLKKYLMWMGCMISILSGVGYIYQTSMNIPFMDEKKEDIFLYRFQEIIEQSENPTLLNIGCLDAGLYTVCDIVPTCQWFQTQTLPIDDVLQEQERYIREGQITYVLARDEYPEVIWAKYELVGEESWQLNEQEFTYYLFRLKGLYV